MSASTPTSLARLRRDAAGCTDCELYRDATQTVFGAGPSSAWLMLVGEQPGDQEDRQGEPFVGPAGRVLDTALERAGIDRSEVYVTNAVKHFRFERDGKRRLHKTPTVGHVRACRQWLDGELAAVRPAVLATLGATAAKALLGSSFRLTRHRGELLDSPLASIVAATIHPSAILRQRDDESRAAERGALADDLRVVVAALSGS
jgi:uracil-DNA glycosylase